MKKILSLILCLIMATSVCSLVGCNKNEAGKEWNVIPYTSDDGESVIDQRVGFSLSRNSKNIKEVWINVKKIEGESVDVTFQKYTTTSENGTTLITPTSGTVLGGSARTITAAQVKTANKESKGWIKVNDKDWDTAYNNVVMTVKGNIVIREVVFVDADGGIISTSIDRAQVVVSEKDKVIRYETFTKAELDGFVDVEDGLPTNLLDDQDSFKTKDED